MPVLVVINAILGIASILSLGFSLFAAGEAVVNVMDVLDGTSTEILGVYDVLLQKLGINIDSLLSAIDATLSGVTAGVCTPECTMTGILNATGCMLFIRGCIYQIINVAVFRFSVFQLKMALLRLAITGIIGKLIGKKN